MNVVHFVFILFFLILGFPYFQFNINKLTGKFGKSLVSESLQLKIGSIDAKTYYIVDPTQDHFCFMSANTMNESSVFEGMNI